MRSASSVDARSRGARRAPDAGRRADVRVDRRHGRRRSGTTRRCRRRNASWPKCCCGVSPARFAPGGFLHYGQGKWYPGEPLPRWALGVYWRARRRSAVARRRADRRYARAGRRRRRRRAALRRRDSPATLGLDPAYRDHRVRGRAEAARRRKRRCPSTPIRCRPISRKPTSARASRACCCAGLDRPAGFVLPLQAPRDEGDDAAPAGEASPWPLRRERLYALAGDSPLGLRLPLASLPDVLPGGRRARARRSIRSRRAARLPDAQRVATAARRRRTRRESRRAKSSRRRCACEVRDGHLYVFMPPLKRLEDYVALLARVEAPRARAGVPVAIEGYTPPRDPRVHGAQRHARSRRDRGQRPSRVVVATN